MEDKHILHLLWNRAESAISALAEKFGKGLYRLAMNILSVHHDAEEAVNDTYLALWNTIPPQKPDPLSAYVYRVGKNTALKKLRHNTAQKRSGYLVSLDELSECIATGTLEEEIDARFLGQAIDRFLDTVSKENRVLFLRRYWFGDSLTELSEAFHISQNTASVRLHRIRTQLYAYLIKEGYFHDHEADRSHGADQ